MRSIILIQLFLVLQIINGLDEADDIADILKIKDFGSSVEETVENVIEGSGDDEIINTTEEIKPDVVVEDTTTEEILGNDPFEKKKSVKKKIPQNHTSRAFPKCYECPKKHIGPHNLISFNQLKSF